MLTCLHQRQVFFWMGRAQPNEIRFAASLHHTQPPLSVSPEGEVKLVLAVPADQLPNVAKCLLLLRSASFDVVIPHESIRRERQGNDRKTYR